MDQRGSKPNKCLLSPPQQNSQVAHSWSLNSPTSQREPQAQNTFRERALANSVWQSGGRRAVSGSRFPEAPKTPLTHSGVAGLMRLIQRHRGGLQWESVVWWYVSEGPGGRSEPSDLIKRPPRKPIASTKPGALTWNLAPGSTEVIASSGM